MQCGRSLLSAVGTGCLVALGFAAAARADESQPSAVSAPPPAGLGRWLNPATAPFIPIPEIDTAPHSGLTLGVIPTVLRTNARDEIEEIIAPDIIHSQYFGWGSRARIFGFPSDDTQWSVVGGLKQRVEREFDGRYITGQTRRGPYTWSLEAIYDRSGIPRFFGLGNRSVRASETSYVDNQSSLEALFGWNLTRALQVAYVARLRYVEVLPGVLHKLPSIEAGFPGLKGVGTEHELQHRLMLVYDTRDSSTIPQDGARDVVYGGFASRAVGSSVAYDYFGAEARRYWPLGRDFTLAWHAQLRYMPSARNAPFWALSSLGGDRSVLAEREPMRAYGDDRFIDRNMFATAIEARTRILSRNAFGTRISLELAPFVDLGKVFAGMGESPISHLHKGLGVGFRAVASPYVVGYVDIGYGHEKASVFSGLNYPF